MELNLPLVIVPEQARGILRREQERAERCVQEVHERRRDELTTQKDRAYP